jgi:glyoxylase-like metal-dependent hydrolase (beta-lactamase superfamily II)
VPGHTSDSVAYRIGDALFTGDSLFMPDGGTARCDFPGGDAAQLYRSIQRLLALPDATRVFICHDYGPGGRAVADPGRRDLDPDRGPRDRGAGGHTVRRERSTGPATRRRRRGHGPDRMMGIDDRQTMTMGGRA